MTQNDKELLIRDLCARLPYGVIVHLKYDENTSVTREMGLGSLHDIMFDSAEGKPYLRPLSSMTEEERDEFEFKTGFEIWSNDFDNQYDTLDNEYGYIDKECIVETFNWLNAHHFDYRGLIEKGLAIAVTEENNPYKELNYE